MLHPRIAHHCLNVSSQVVRYQWPIDAQQGMVRPCNSNERDFQKPVSEMARGHTSTDHDIGAAVGNRLFS